MENQYINTNANTEANNTAEKSEFARMSFGGTLGRILIETPMAVGYAHSIIHTTSEASLKHCKEIVGRYAPAPVHIDSVCEAVIAMFKDPKSALDKDKFLHGAVAFMLAHQMNRAYEERTGKSREVSDLFHNACEKEEPNG